MVVEMIIFKSARVVSLYIVIGFVMYKLGKFTAKALWRYDTVGELTYLILFTLYIITGIISTILFQTIYTEINIKNNDIITCFIFFAAVCLPVIIYIIGFYQEKTEQTKSFKTHNSSI